ncbi:hypothetical protein AWZ03_003029 [Drosophila navojoa]|uniref:Sodium channel protein Nach n=1 Tax=Drosophila navojoa TaxID=7232 RepID=A0A484BQV6_DRONA|nr:hypothetical protein AWZ03_003029 [Drosophila navojoa]
MKANAERVGPAVPSKRLVVGRAAWWIAKPRARPPAPLTLMAAIREEESAARKLSFADAVKDLLQNLSFHCYGKLVEHGRGIQERFFWLICHITALTMLIAFVWGTYKDAADELVTTLYDPLYAVSKVPLPAVTICSQNRLSRRAVWRYAQELSSKDPRKRNATYFYTELRAFSLYYGIDENIDDERILRLQSLLDQLDTRPHDLFFNPKERLRILTPKCSDILISCRLGGRPFDCMQEFQQTLSSFGFCCTFNSNGRYIALNEIHNYPDPQSGGVTVRYLKTGRSTYLPVRPQILETLQEARRIRPAVRKCRFWDEMPHNFTRRYTFSKCISACRAHSIYSLCQCLPFQLPMHYIGGATGRLFCTLQHMQCLRHYTFKWMNVITSRDYVPGLEHEMEDALYCPHCLPSCSEIRYNVRGAGALTLRNPFGNMTNVHDGNISSPGNNNYGHDSSELAVVRIYFAETHIQYFRQIIKNDWYEIFSTIGNICGIIAGFSLIGICELLFFVAKQLWHAYKAERKSELFHTHCHTPRRSRARTRANGRAKATQQRQPMELLILP